MNAAVWDLEWLQAWRRRRVMAFSVGVPLALVVLMAAGQAPAPHAALVFTVLFTFFGVFGAAIPWARDAERGWLHRIELTGFGMPRLVAQRVAASALLDLLELLPALAVIALFYGPTASQFGWLMLGVAGGLFVANALGVLVAHIASSLAETALLAAVISLLLLHAAGVFRPPQPGGFADALQQAIPFHYMSLAIRAAVGAP